MMYQYILFDLDGTITDSRRGITKSVQYALKHFGIEESNLDKLLPFIGPPLRASFMKYYHFSAKDAEIAVATYRIYFQAEGLYDNDLYEGIEALLKNLKSQNKIIAIASSKPEVFVKKIIEYYGLDGYFTEIVGSELDGRREKKEEVVAEVLERLIQLDKSRYKECIMIGDRKFDIEGGIKNEIASMGVTYGFGSRKELEKAGATYVVETVKEIEKKLCPSTTV